MTVQPPALPSRRGLRLSLPLLFVLVLALVTGVAYPTPAHATACLTSVTCNPANAWAVAGSDGVAVVLTESGVTGAAAAGVTAGTSSAAAGAATAATGTGVSLTQTAFSTGGLVAAIGGFFGVKALMADAPAPVGGSNPSVPPGWTGTPTFTYPDFDGVSRIQGSISVTYDPAYPQSVVVTVLTGKSQLQKANDEHTQLYRPAYGTCLVAGQRVTWNQRAQLAGEPAPTDGSGPYLYSTVGPLASTHSSDSRGITCPAGSIPGVFMQTPSNEQSPWGGIESRWEPPTQVDATATLRSTWACRNGSTNIPTTSSVTSASFPYTKDTALDIPDMPCASGSWLETGTVDLVLSTGEVTRLLDYLAPKEVQDFAKDSSGCLSRSDCVLDLLQVQPDGSTRSCFTAGVTCTNWQADTSRTYRCTFGGQTIDASRCGVYRDPGTASTTPTHDVQVGKPAVPTTPDPTTTTPPSTGTTPGQAGQPDTPEGRECFPSGWGLLNPVDWVLKPTKCALSWAFVPSTATSTAVADVATSLQGKSPAPELGSIFAWLDAPDGRTSACFVIDLDVPFTGSTVHVIDSCGNDPYIAWLRDNRSLVSALMWLSILSPLAWWFWREYAPGSKGVA